MLQGMMTDKQMAGILENAFTYKEELMQNGFDDCWTKALILLGKTGIAIGEAGQTICQIDPNLKEALMNDKEKEIFGRDLLRMYDSLHNAVFNAGGTGSMFSPRGVQETSILEMMVHLAPNKIGFYCKKTHNLVEINKNSS